MVLNYYYQMKKNMKDNTIHNLYSLYNKYIDFNNKKILDFGGNFDNLIRSANGIIKNKNYTVIDVDKEAIEEGKRNYPDATWIYSNEYNPVYNPEGIEKLQLYEKYDLIWAYSVFTHTSYENFKDHIKLFKQHLNVDGQIAITFLNQNAEHVKKYFYNQRINRYGECDNLIFNNKITYLVDNKISSIIPNKCEFLLTWYDESILEQYGIIKHCHPLDLLII